VGTTSAAPVMELNTTVQVQDTFGSLLRLSLCG
jgi:hypothetical protein